MYIKSVSQEPMKGLGKQAHILIILGILAHMLVRNINIIDTINI